MPWRKAGAVPEQARGLVDLLTHGMLRAKRSLPKGRSLCPAKSWLSLSPSQRKTQEERWHNALANGHGPEHVWDELAFSIKGPWALRVHLASDNDLAYWLLIQENDEPLVYARRQLDLAAGEAHHDYLAVVARAQGSGTGAQVLANAVAVYKMVGISQVHLVAGLNAGGAVWAKFGFRPLDGDAWGKLKGTIRANLLRMRGGVVAAFENEHGRTLQDAVEAVLQIPSPDGIWDLVDIDAGGRTGRAAGLVHGIAGALLLGSRWRGVLDLADPDAELRFRSYIETKARRGQTLLPPHW
jgi:GNAT superfamily N-acetyltransferase